MDSVEFEEGVGIDRSFLMWSGENRNMSVPNLELIGKGVKVSLSQLFRACKPKRKSSVPTCSPKRLVCYGDYNRADRTAGLRSRCFFVGRDFVACVILVCNVVTNASNGSRV